MVALTHSAVAEHTIHYITTPRLVFLLTLFALGFYLSATLLLLLDGQQLDNVLVLDFLQDLKLAHLDLLRPHVRQLVERLHRNRLPIVLVHTLKENKRNQGLYLLY